MEIDKNMLEKYWSGQCSLEERIAVEAWMADGVPDQDYELHAPAGEDALKARLWHGIEAKHHDAQEKAPDEEPQESPDRRRYPFLLPIGIAASLIFAIIFYRLQHEVPDKQVPLPLAEYREIKVPYGQKMKVTLPDSSRVFLNAGTTFTYPVLFDEKQRHVRLDGEGFFEITPDADKPFIVETPYTEAKVLGTRFNIRSRDIKRSSLTVEEGRVQFTARGCTDTLLLTANKQGIYNGKNIKEADVNSRIYTAWTSGEIIFDGIPLSDAIRELERWYDVSIKLQQAHLADYRIKASFSNAALSSVLHDLAFSMNIKYTIKDKEVMIYQ